MKASIIIRFRITIETDDPPYNDELAFFRIVTISVPLNSSVTREYKNMQGNSASPFMIAWICAVPSQSLPIKWKSARIEESKTRSALVK